MQLNLRDLLLLENRVFRLSSVSHFVINNLIEIKSEVFKDTVYLLHLIVAKHFARLMLLQGL